MKWRKRSDGEEAVAAESGIERERSRIARILALDASERTDAEMADAMGYAVSCPTCGARPFGPCTRTTGLRGLAPMHAPRRAVVDAARRVQRTRGPRGSA